jgi:hypothetical protein
LVTGATFRSHSLSNCRSKVCSSSPKYEKTWKTNCCRCLIKSCYVNARLLKSSMTNWRIFRKSSIPAIAGQLIFLLIW